MIHRHSVLVGVTVLAVTTSAAAQEATNPGQPVPISVVPISAPPPADQAPAAGAGPVQPDAPARNGSDDERNAEALEPSPNVRLTVTAGVKNAVVERRVTTEESYGHVAIALPLHTRTEVWEQVCVAPCSVSLPRASSYRIATANGLPGTKSFTLRPNRETLDLQVRPGNLRAFATGGTLTGLGVAGLITGTVLFAAAGKFQDESDYRVGGAITAGAGLALMAVGIPLLILNQTKVYSDGSRIAKAPAPTGPHLTATGLAF